MCRLAMSKALPLRVCRVLSAFCKAPQVGRNSTVLRTQLSMSTGLLPSCAALAWMGRLRVTSPWGPDRPHRGRCRAPEGCRSGCRRSWCRPGPAALSGRRTGSGARRLGCWPAQRGWAGAYPRAVRRGWAGWGRTRGWLAGVERAAGAGCRVLLKELADGAEVLLVGMGLPGAQALAQGLRADAQLGFGLIVAGQDLGADLLLDQVGAAGVEFGQRHVGVGVNGVHERAQLLLFAGLPRGTLDGEGAGARC